MSLIKFMGSSDIRVIPAGSDFGGRLATPLERDVVWDWDNGHVVDTDRMGLRPEVVDLILEEPGFQDVTGLERLPLNDAQVLWRGMSDEPRTGDLPPGFVGLGALPTSQDQYSGGVDPAPEAVAFAHTINDTPDDPIVEGTAAPEVPDDSQVGTSDVVDLAEATDDTESSKDV